MEKLKVVLCSSILMLALASAAALAVDQPSKAAPPAFAALKGMDIGSPDQPGQTVVTNNSAEIGAGGRDIGGTADQFHFSYVEVAGDFDFKVRVESLANSDVWAKAGLMVRESLEAGSAFVGAFATPSISGTVFQSRLAPGINATSAGNFPVNYPWTWLRLRRAGDAIAGFAGVDGKQWQLLGTNLLSSTNALLLGLATTSHNTNQTTTARFRDLGDASGDKIATIHLEREPPGPSSRKTGLVISEIMYHPKPRADGKDMEFIEILNSNPWFEDISGFRLTGIVDFIFPPGTVLAAGSFAVVAHSPGDMRAAFSSLNVYGPYTNSLLSAGTLRLRSRAGAILLEVSFSDANPWPAAAAGAGHSLVLARPSYGEGSVKAWDASASMGGSPGVIDPTRTSPLQNVRINEFLANTDAPLLDFIELYNHSNEAVDLSACSLSDNPNLPRYSFPSGSTIPARGLFVLDEKESGFSLNSQGEGIYLNSADGTWVVDAVRFGPQETGVSSGRFPDGAAAFRPLDVPTAGLANSGPPRSGVIINEIMYNPISGDDDDEYVELYNRGKSAVDLSGWSFISGIEFTFPTGTKMAAESYLVLARNAARLKTNYANLDAGNTLGDYKGRLSNRGERIALGRPEEVISHSGSGNNPNFITNFVYSIVDEVTYGEGGQWGQWADGGGSSLELIDSRSDNDLPSNWADSDESAKAPWTTIEHTGVLDNGNGIVDSLQLVLLGAGEALVDNVEVIGSAGTNSLANPTFENGTAGWFFQGTHDQSGLETTEGFNSSQSLHIRASGRGDNGANRIRTALPSPRPTPGSSATLRAKARWLRGHPEMLLRLKGNYLEATGPLAVPKNLGTPGAKNSRAVPNAGPAIYDVTHAPVLPAANQDVVVTTRVFDPDGITRLELNFRVDPDPNFTAVVMTDDGTNGDAIAGDGIFSAIVPGQAAAITVAFFVRATDAAPNPATTQFPADAPARECLVRFGETTLPSNFGTYRIWLTQATTAKWRSRLKLHNGPLDATFVYGNSRVIYNMGVLYSGSPFVSPGYTGPTGVLCGYVMQFPADQPFLGATDFVLDWPIRDSTQQLEQIAYWMADQLDLPRNYRRFIHLYVNGSKRSQIYEDAQQPNSDMLEQYFPDDSEGDLHKVEDWFEFTSSADMEFNVDATLQDFTTTNGEKKLARYRWNWRKRALQGSANDYGALFNLVDALNTPDPDAYTKRTDELVDLDEWMGIFAIEHIVGNWDSYGYNRGKNMFAYKPRDGKWQLMIWDIDFVLGAGGDGPDTPMEFANDPTISRMYFHPPFARVYHRAMQAAVEGPLAASKVVPVMDARYAALRANGVTATSPTAGKRFIESRRAFLLQQLDAVQAKFEITSNDGDSFSTERNLVTLAGTAPVTVAAILVNGIAYPLTWDSEITWRMRLPLSEATNSLVLQGVDSKGNLIADSRDAVTITYTGPFVSPLDHLVINEIMYAPAVTNAEFVEIHNTSTNVTFDLSSYSVTGIDFTFPPGTLIEPTGYVVIAKNKAAFAEAYGSSITVVGEFQGNLRQSRETLRLLKPGPGPTTTVLVDEVTYGSDAPWPEKARGGGISLQLANPFEDNNRAANWAAVDPTPRWRFVSATGTAGGSSRLLIYHSPFQPEPDATDIAGRWEGTIGFSGQSFPFTVRFLGSVSNWTGDYVFDQGSVPLTVTFTNSVISFYFTSDPTVRWRGTISADGSSITGDFTQPDQNGATLKLQFALTRKQEPGVILGGEVFIDDVKLVSGAVPEAGQNLVRNGDFESSLENVWNVSSNHNGTALSSLEKHSGVSSLHLVASRGGGGQETSFWQIPDPLTSGATYTLSYWYLPSTNGTELTVRLADGNLSSTHRIAPDRAATPGEPNSVPPPSGSAPALILSEVLPINNTGITDQAGDRDPWIEIFNAGSEAINLSEFSLSDEDTDLRRWTFPANAAIQPAEYLIVWLDREPAESTSTEWHANFRAPTRGSILLAWTANGQSIVVDSIAYLQASADSSIGFLDPARRGSVQALPTPTPGAANNSVAQAATVLISEWMADNTAALADVRDGDFEDWFELFNAGPKAVDLTGYTLTDDPANIPKFVIPPGTVIPPLQFLLVWADEETGQNVATNQDQLHVNFKLSANGEFIGLFTPNGTLIDSVQFGAQFENVSQGRRLDRQDPRFYFMPSPTPLISNVIPTATGQPARITAVTLSPTRRLTLTWNSEAGLTYQVQYKASLDDPQWVDLGDPIFARGTTTSFSNDTIPTQVHGFYRILP